MKNTLSIAQAQMPVLSDRAACLEYLHRTAEQSVKANASLLCLPEMFCCPYDIRLFSRYAEEEGGSLWTECSRIARNYHIFFSAGTMPELDEHGRIYNTAYVFSPDGSLAAKYRKMHLFDIDLPGRQTFQESAVLSPGEKVTVFDTEFGPIGLAICFDIRFPEQFRLMAAKGARVVIAPASFNMTTGPDHWELLYRAQSLNSQCFLIGTAPARDETSSYVSWSHSIITDPWGRVVSQAGYTEELRITGIDLGQADEIRTQIPSFPDSRIHLSE